MAMLTMSQMGERDAREIKFCVRDFPSVVPDFRRVRRYSGAVPRLEVVFSAMKQRFSEPLTSWTMSLALHVCGDNMLTKIGGGEHV